MHGLDHVHLPFLPSSSWLMTPLIAPDLSMCLMLGTKLILHETTLQALSSTTVTDNCAPTALFNPSLLRKDTLNRSNGSSIPKGQISSIQHPNLSPTISPLSHPDQHSLVLASLNLSPVQVKHEETPICLDQLQQSLSLQCPLK
ncbi:hypothetical protein IEO21_07075 [Rhodonia placenta]|uniref:Uncharacterized protein n=1 Tax=Rhodonia placenta TaxID=104341 RepID=A0A8H7NYT1_9APHY|nr:hypothetical protein IEO21_07075 [Postia placenta]